MKNVAKRMRMGDVARAVIAWQMGLHEAKSQERAERIMFRVGMRMKNRELSDAVLEWRTRQVEEKQRLRAEGIMRRVGGRMRNRELALNYAEWCRNYRGDVVTMWQNRNAQLTMELETLQMKFMMTTQVRGRVRQCGVHARMRVCAM